MHSLRGGQCRQTVGIAPPELVVYTLIHLNRPLLLLGATIQTLALAILDGLGTPSTITDSLKIRIVSMLAVASFGFSLGWGCLTYVVTTELPALKLGDDTLWVGFMVNVAFKFVEILLRALSRQILGIY